MYQPLDDLKIKQSFTGEATNLYRDLDIARAIATSSFDAGGVHYTRELFISAPDQAVVIRLKASKAKADQG